MKKNPSKKRMKLPKIPIIFTMGELDLILKIDFEDEDLIKKNEDNNTQEKIYYSLDDLTDIKSLSFIKNNFSILKKFEVKSKNELLKSLLIGSKNSDNLCQIDFISYNIPIFSGDESFFNDILNYVTEKNGLNLNKTPLSENCCYSIIIQMSHKGKKKEIIISKGETDPHENDNILQEEGATKEEYNKEEEGEDEYGDYEENEAMKKGLIPKFKRKYTILKNLYPISSKYDMIYLNFEDLSKMKGNFKLEDMFELLEFFKKNTSTIFVNYFSSEKIIDKDREYKSQNNSQVLEENKKDDIQLIDRFYKLTDIYFFDKKQTIKLFSKHLKEINTKEPKRIISSRNVYEYFIKNIIKRIEPEEKAERVGLFLDEFNKFGIIQISSQNKIKIKEFDAQPYKKINPHNIKEIEEYKEIIKSNKKDLYSLFLSNLVISMGSSPLHCTQSEVLFPAFLTGMELVKRKVEFLRNNITIPDTETFYTIRKEKKIISRQLSQLNMSEKEGKFLLDCTNKITSNKKEYVSLYDSNLKNFFSNINIRKNLYKNGFIDNRGYIMYDPVYKEVMKDDCIGKKINNEKELHDKIISSIKEIKIYNRIKDKEIDSSLVAMKEKPVTIKKIPYFRGFSQVKKRKIIRLEK